MKKNLIYLAVPTFLLLFMVIISFSKKNKKESGQSAQMQVEGKPVLLFVGNYSQKEPRANGKGEGIFIYEMNSASGALAYVATSTKTTNPSYIVVHPNKQWLYAVNELDEGMVSAFRINRDKKQLEFINAVSSHGNSPCHISIDQSGKFAMIANYGTGNVALFPIETDGSLKEASSLDMHVGKGSTDRQAGPHAHMITMGTNNQFVYATDLGTDQIYIYELDTKNEKLIKTDHNASTIAGTGPRHLAFHRSQPWVYAVGELNGTIEAYAIDKTTGGLNRFQTVSTLPQGEKRDAACADIHISPSGKYLYASNRGEVNSIAMYSIEPKTGNLTLLGHQPVFGKSPRNFVIDPSGTFLLVANQNSDNVVTFKINPATGLLVKTGIEAKVPAPVCLKFLD